MRGTSHGALQQGYGANPPNDSKHRVLFIQSTYFNSNFVCLIMNNTVAILKTAFLLILLQMCCSVAFAQKTASPFDIIPRLPESEFPDSVITISASSNPFDINRISSSSTRPTGFTPQFQVQRKRKTLSAKEKNALYQRFLIITVMIMLIILTLVFTIFRIFIAKIWKAFLNDNILSQLLREQAAGVTVAYIILYLMFIVNAGVFAFLVLRHYGLKIANSNISTLLLCMGGVAGFYVFKHLLFNLMRFIFPIEKEISQYNFTVMIFNIITGIFLVPMVLMIAYSSAGIASIVIKLTILLVLGTILFRTLRGLFIANRFFVWHKFHFFLYLCTVELAPLLITFKLLNVI